LIDNIANYVQIEKLNAEPISSKHNKNKTLKIATHLYTNIDFHDWKRTQRCVEW